MYGYFFSKLSSIVNFVGSSSKRHSQLKSIRGNEIIDLIKSGELGTGTRVNQASTLQRPASTHWSSHYTSIIRVIELFGSICTLLEDLIGGKLTFGIRAEAKGLLKVMMTFDFVFMLLLMHRVLETSDMLCQALQRKNQDILNAMSLVATTKLLFQKMRDDEWDDFLWSVNNFCDTHDIVVPDLTDRYIEGTKRSCQQKNQFTVEEFYHFHVFNVVIDKQLMKLNTRFTEESIELLILCEALNPSDGFKSFSESAIYSLIEKFYPSDFSKDDMKHLKTQLDHYKLDVFEDPRFKDVDSLPKLCQLLVETKKSRIYFVIDKLIRLVLTLPVSTATTERAFSGMKLLKTPLCNKMEQEYLNNAMILYIEKEIACEIDIEYIIDMFDLLKNRRLQLK
ncbi:zinc finger MYM-type protein 1-like [Zingiber officinale]|uniref:zinc finger MYM-type protein 1-like n=1 Tax=Zingiber officinale TaxID=94328 RepID=UPI001C4AC3C8|nr:zinc finger MYM-type protein 1-like [Zingiber officinale]